MSHRAQPYGSQRTTAVKAHVVSEYVAFYGKALSDQGFTTAYFDAFAGSGWTELSDAPGQQEGVALRVLKANHQLDYYVFNDIEVANIASLRASVERLRQDSTLREVSGTRIDFTVTDGNVAATAACDWVAASSMRRAVLVLDPFGMQVRWKTMERIAASRRIDVWVLVPIGQGLNRLMQRHGKIPEERRRLIDESLGGSGWEELLFPQQEGLFSDFRPRGSPTSQQIADYYLRRLRETFPAPAVHPTGLPLYRNGQLQYLLAFACANPDPKAYLLALKGAKHLIRQAQRPPR